MELLTCVFNKILALINTPVGSLQLNGNLLFFLHLQILIQQPLKHKEANQKQICGLSRGWAPRVSNRTKSGNKCKTPMEINTVKNLLLEQNSCVTFQLYRQNDVWVTMVPLSLF